MHHSILGIIQVKFDSPGLPGKAMLPISGKPLLEHVIDRFLAVKKIDDIVISTGNSKSNDVIVDLAEEKNCKVFRSSDEDVLKRFYNVANTYPHDYVVKSIDSPFIDVNISSNMIKHVIKHGYDFLGLKGAPPGAGVEIFKKSALDHAYCNTKKKTEKEHVSSYIKMNSHLFEVEYYEVNLEFANEASLIVQNSKSLEVAQLIYKKLYKGKPFSTKKVLSLIEKDKNIRDLLESS